MEKQNKIAIKQNLIREQNEYEEMERKEKINKMNLKRLEIREKNQELMDKKKFETQNKIDNKSKSVERLMISKDLENQRIIKINNEKYNMVLNHIDDLKKLDRKKRDDTSKLLDEKSKKIDNFKKNREINNEKNNKIKEIISNNRREFELEFKPIYHYKKIDDNTMESIRRRFPENNIINNILIKNKLIEEEEKRLEEEKKENWKKRQKEIEEREASFQKKNKNKLIGTLNQTFKDSKKYKKIDDNDFYNTNNFINTNKINYYNSAQDFYTSNQKKEYNNLNKNNQINNLDNNENVDYNKLEDKEILIRELLNEYHIKLNNELYEFIESEEKKEKERINLYHNTSINKKEELKQQLAEERLNSTNMIKKLIEDNDKKYQEFENELKTKFNFL